jgi:diketogulonate reductase-like aldo/keto reductase
MQLLYGTAWKEDETERLTRLALEAGFRGIDTANQRKHYFEAAVGVALQSAIADGLVKREDVFLQTKFTSRGGQDHRLPYDPNADPATQVRQSFESSLEHLQVDVVDSYVLHSPSRYPEVWRAMEELHGEGRTRFLGISNTSLDQLEALCDRANVKPAYVQNRCFASTGWDRDVRAFCREHDITYQGFSLLTANGNELLSAPFRAIVKRTGATTAQVVFRFAQKVGMLPLTGTTDPAHMREDLASDQVELSDDDVAAIENLRR